MSPTPSRRDVASDAPPSRDRGAVDLSIEMLFGVMAVLLAMLVIVESVTYWHARNVYDDAASEGARVAAAFDGTCAQGIAAARSMIVQHAGGWAGRVTVTCIDGPSVIVTVSGSTPGILAPAVGLTARVVESAPKEG